MTGKDLTIGNPSAAAAKKFVHDGPKPKRPAGVKEGETRLTVDISDEAHDALSFAKTKTKRQMKTLVEEALRMHPDVAQFLPPTAPSAE